MSHLWRCAGCALGLATTASAQGERGVISGTLSDAQGGVLPGVTVTVRNVDTGFSQTDVTGANGQYRFGALPMGKYELKAELVGFTTATVTNLTISINREVWTLRTTAPFSARAGKDLNNDGANTDYVPGTHKGQGNRDLDIGLVNAWRAQNGLGPIDPAQISSNGYNRFDIRLSKAIALGNRRRVELIGQVFNLFGRDNLGGIGSSFNTNALSPDAFGRLTTAQPRQQAELAVRVVF